MLKVIKNTNMFLDKALQALERAKGTPMSLSSLTGAEQSFSW
jgi:hypothetical protein